MNLCVVVTEMGEKYSNILQNKTKILTGIDKDVKLKLCFNHFMYSRR